MSAPRGHVNQPMNYQIYTRAMAAVVHENEEDETVQEV